MRLLLTGDDQYSHWRRSVFLQPAIGVLTTPHKGYKVQEWLFRESPKAVFGDEDRLLQLARQALSFGKTTISTRQVPVLIVASVITAYQR